MPEQREKHSRPVPGGRAFWWTERLWAESAGLPVVSVPIDAITEFDENCWFGDTPPTCRQVAEHARRIESADLRRPVILHADGGLMDGGHRIARAWLDGRTEVDAVRFEVDPEPDWIEPAAQESSETKDVDPDDVRTSKRLSLVLRHRPEAAGLELDPKGWIDVGRLLKAFAAADWQLSRESLDRVVTGNDKQRFEWDVVRDRIRARQGHSVAVELDLPPATPPAVLFHGTPRRNIDSILATGLHRRQRHHVHLSPDRETAAVVGARRGDHVVLTVDAARMAEEGHNFWVTENNVWLTDEVEPRYLAVVDLDGD